MNSGVPADRLLASIGMAETGPAKWILNDYFNATRLEPSGRSVAGFMKVMDSRFKRSSEELIMAKLTQWNDFKRKKGEDIRMFWIRFDRLRGQLRGMNVEWAEKLTYTKAYHALELQVEHRVMVNAMMESTQKPGSIDELKRASVKILDAQDRKLDEELFTTQGKEENTLSEPDRAQLETKGLRHRKRLQKL